MHPTNSVKTFEDLKVGSAVVVCVGGYARSEYYIGKVIKRTKTRLTVTYPETNESGEVFTTDGEEYPRAHGYGRHVRLEEANAANVETYKRSHAIRRAKHALHRFSEAIQTPDAWYKLTETEVRCIADMLEDHIATIQNSEVTK
jgi:hypothetical protein